LYFIILNILVTPIKTSENACIYYGNLADKIFRFLGLEKVMEMNRIFYKCIYINNPHHQSLEKSWDFIGQKVWQPIIT